RWLDAVLTPLATRRTLVAMLIGLELAYVAAVGAAVVGAAAFGLGVYRSRRRRADWHLPARGLLVCASGLLAFVLAEGSAAAWRAANRPAPARAAGDPALPVRFAEAPGEDELTLTVLGESSAEGMPYNAWLSIGRIVAWQLGRAIPSRR